MLGGALCLALIAGCSDLGKPLRLAPRIELSATSVDFGTVALSGSATRTIVVGNSGNADLRGNATLACAGYSFDAGGGPFTVAPGGQHTIVVRFQPTNVGASPCELSLGAGLPAIALAGSASLQSPGAAAQISVASLDFGFIAIGGSRTHTFTVLSTGTAPLNVDVSAGCGSYSIVANGGPATLAPGDSLVVTVGIVTTTGGHFGCTIATGPGLPDVAVVGDVTSVSFGNQIHPIIQSRCASCHQSWQYDDLVNQPIAPVNSGPCAALNFTYVVPYDLGHSLLYLKLTRPPCGRLMPEFTSGLPPAQVDLFQRWITEGAHDN